MGENPTFERPASPDEENKLILARSEYLLQHIKEQDEQIKQGGIDVTGAYTRKKFVAELDRVLHKMQKRTGGGGEFEEKRARPESLEKFSLVMLDIDYFKKVNDTFGHPAGDAVLKEVVEVLTHSIRDEDIVARWGGEEFIVLLREADLQSAREKAEELRLKVEQLVFPEYPELRVTASFGVVCSDSSDDPKELEDDADKALYRAKEGGRNRVEVYEPLPTASE